MSVVAMLATVLVAGCAWIAGTLPTPAPITDAVLDRLGSATLAADEAQVITDNDQAFASKVRMIEEARRSIDMAYYIFADDYSSSYLTRALIDAARRGVTVRLLVDYVTNYRRLDLFSMMEKLGNNNLAVRLYGRPTRNVVMDAVYMTMSCGKEAAPDGRPGRCARAKFSEIDRLFSDETIDGRAAAARNISNLNVGNSGLFLSGLYAKTPDVMATAVLVGQDIDTSKLGSGASSATPEDKENLKKLGQLYWRSRTGAPFQRLVSKFELYLASTLYGEKLDPIQEMFTGLLPVDRPFPDEERKDWDHFTDYLHHKLLVVDGVRMQMGGRNVEDSYHMHPNALTQKYVFMDTDLRLHTTRGGGGVVSAFEALWNFEAMVATLADVRRHAPNDLVANTEAHEAARQACGTPRGQAADDACVTTEFASRARDLGERIAQRAADMERRANVYRTEYLPQVRGQGGPAFEVDRDAQFVYLENLPFDRTRPAPDRRRTYGAPVGKELESGKNIHHVWLGALTDACRAADPAHPTQVILHNAYFYPPANFIHALSRMVNGDLDCSRVSVTVLTNSIQTTDLNIVNLLARHAWKAFTEFYRGHDTPRRAKFTYAEYHAQPGAPSLSLHTKLSVLGNDLMVGSANADVRSYMMDSNNAMFIRHAPRFTRAYTGFVQGILGDPSRVRSLDEYFASTSREVMREEDLKTFREILAKYHVDRHLDASQRGDIEKYFTEMLDQAYTLTRDSIAAESRGSTQRDRQNTFNARFKSI